MKIKRLPMIILMALVVGLCSIIVHASTVERESVETIISELNIGETYYEPPEIYIIETNEQENTSTWVYQYTANIPAKGFSEDIGGAEAEEVSYYYKDAEEYQIRIDEEGRIRSYTSNFDANNPRWVADSFAQEDIVEVVKQASASLNVDISTYSDITYMPESELTMIYFYRDQSSPYTDWVSAQFNSQGMLEGIIYYYSGIEELSIADEEYFDNIINNYLLLNNTVTSYTVKTTYRVRDNTLLAFYNVIFSDLEQGTWVENYVAGKPIE